MDVHKRMIEVCFLDEQGQRQSRQQVACTREAIQAFAEKHLEPSDRVVLEATTNTWSVVDLLEPSVAEVVVSNPLRTRAIASAKVKTDKIDARVLAELLHSGYLPEVWQPDAQTRRLRGLTRRRASLVGQRTAVKNRLHSTLAQRLIVVPVKNLFSKKGFKWLRELELDEDGRWMLDSDLRLLEAIEKEIEDLAGRMAKLAYRREQARLLMTLPGCDVAVAQAVLAAWGDPSRFEDADRAASYLGLVPKTRQSASKCFYGRITKQGNSQARWLLIQAAQHLDKHPGPLGVFFRRVAKKKNRNVAVVAAARKMATIAWHMLQNNEPYRYATPDSTQAKLARLRVRATGERRRGGTAKGTPRPSHHGQKLGRAIPSLPQVYESEQLPSARALAELPEGEVRALRASGALDHARQIEQMRRRPRKGEASEATAKKSALRASGDGEKTPSHPQRTA